MVYDLELVEGAYGVDEGFTMQFKNDDGSPEDLTIYNTVRLVFSDMQYTSPPVLNHTQIDDELSVDSDGDLKYLPTIANPVPAFGKYYVQVLRIDTVPPEVQKPAMKFSLLITRKVPTS